MGNTESAAVEEVPVVAPPVQQEVVDHEAVAASVIQRKWKQRGPTEFKWPGNLHEELTDMHDLATLGTLLDPLFKALQPEDMEELGLNPTRTPTPAPTESTTSPVDDTKETTTSQPTADLPTNGQPITDLRSPQVTLARLHDFIEEKKELLKANKTTTSIIDELLALLRRIGETMSTRRLLLVAFDTAKLENQGLYYFIVRDNKLKRVTLIFPADSSSYDKEWGRKMNHPKEMATLKRALKARVSGDRIAKVGVHQGFYNFLLTKQTSKQPLATSKYAELLIQLSALFQAHPKHRMYITGHGAAGAIAQLLAFFLTFEDSVDIPKPISCVSFGSPRVGDGSFWRACQLLEIAAKMRTCRVVMAKGDSMPCYPCQDGYTHAGYQVALREDNSVVPAYPTTKDDGMPRFNWFTGSAEKNATKTSQEYMDALEASADALKVMDLNQLYVEVGAKSLMSMDLSDSPEGVATSGTN